MEESAMSGYYGDRDEDSFQEYDGKIFSQFLWKLCDDIKVQKVFENCVFLLVIILWLTSFQQIFADSSEDHTSPSDLECGSESDTYFASISKSDKNNEMPFNLSFSTISSDQITHSSPKKSCDQESSSGISSSPNTASDNSPSCSYAFVPKSPLGISGHSSHIWSLNSSRKNTVSSDSDMSSPRCSEKLGATSYMTLRRTTKRKSRQSLCYSASFSGQHWKNVFMFEVWMKWWMLVFFWEHVEFDFRMKSNFILKDVNEFMNQSWNNCDIRESGDRDIFWFIYIFLKIYIFFVYFSPRLLIEYTGQWESFLWYSN